MGGILTINADKTEYRCLSIRPPMDLNTQQGKLRQVEDFKYLGSWIRDTEKDIRPRKAQAWESLKMMDHIWKGRPPRKLAIRLFRATAEYTLLDSCETWTLHKRLVRELDGCYTRMLQHVLQVSWREHMPNEQLCRDTPKISTTIPRRRLRHAGHIYPYEQPAKPLLLWKPSHGKQRSGRLNIDFVTLLEDDTHRAVTRQELGVAMADRSTWRREWSLIRARPPDL